MLEKRLGISENRLLRVLELTRKIELKEGKKEEALEEWQALLEFLRGLPKTEKEELASIVSLGEGKHETFETALASWRTLMEKEVLKALITKEALGRSVEDGLKKLSYFPGPAEPNPRSADNA